jgi:hypothetical protein
MNQLEFALGAQLGLIRQRQGQKFANVMKLEIMYSMRDSTCVDAMRDMGIMKGLASAAYAPRTSKK